MSCPSPAEPSPATHIGAHFWRGRLGFRRDLRHIDHAALHYALRHCREVRCAFLFERERLDPLPVCKPPRRAALRARRDRADAPPPTIERPRK
ncbi:conserved protein of unknown function [Ralstonia solanacearum CMR15]|nr:conserved protein of unknown function [Ralstonia solanacearum CMR15]